MDELVVVFCFDQGFARHAAVAITSLCVHAETPYKIYCLTTKLEPAEKAYFKRISARFSVDIKMVDIDDRFKDWKTTVVGHNSANYFRLMIPEIIDEPRAIYMDCDVLVTCDLSELFRHKLGENLIGGCHDKPAGLASTMPTHGNERGPYLNCGVLLLNLDAMRSIRFADKAHDVYQKYLSHIVQADQDVINKVIETQKTIIDGKWNVMAHDAILIKRSVREHMEPFVGKGVLHFSGPIKPWHTSSSSWERETWRQYVAIAGVSFKLEIRQPVRLNEWKTYAKGLEEDERWEEAATAYKQIADHFERKAAR